MLSDEIDAGTDDVGVGEIEGNGQGEGGVAKAPSRMWAMWVGKEARPSNICVASTRAQKKGKGAKLS